MGINAIKRSIVYPTWGSKDQTEEIGKIERQYSQLALEVVDVHNSFQANQYSVAGGLGTLAVILDSPFADANYSVAIILNWNAYGYLTAISATGYTITFSANSPGGGGTMFSVVVR